MIHLSRTDNKNMISFWSLFGRKVISRSGDYCGRIIGLYMEGDSVKGFLIWYRFRKIHADIIYLKNLDSLDREAALLFNMDPFYILPGRRVYDSDGRKLGRVIRAVQIGGTNDFEALLVRKHFFSRTLRIKKERIEVSKRNIILRGPGELESWSETE